MLSSRRREADAALTRSRLRTVVGGGTPGTPPPIDGDEVTAAPTEWLVMPQPQPQPSPSPERAAGERKAVATETFARLRAASPRLVADPGRRGIAALAVVAVLACAIAGWLAWRARPQVERVDAVQVAVGSPAIGETPAPAPVPIEVVVAVEGDVRRPGLVRLPPGSRVADAVEAAGGLVRGAVTHGLNLARKVVDGELITVGGVPAAVGTGPPQGSGAGGGLVDLNTATVAELDALPGVGPVLAQRIVDHRQQHGPFGSVEALRDVNGIGAARFADLRDRVTV